MYERILVALDHSAGSDHVLAAAKELASMSKAKVWVLHLREREVIAQMGDVPSETEDEATQAVNGAVKELTGLGLEAHGEVRDTTFGHAAREIMADAQEHDVNVIVMGSSGRGDWAGAILGSTAHKVIHLTDRPVLVVR